MTPSQWRWSPDSAQLPESRVPWAKSGPSPQRRQCSSWLWFPKVWTSWGHRARKDLRGGGEGEVSRVQLAYSLYLSVLLVRLLGNVPTPPSFFTAQLRCDLRNSSPSPLCRGSLFLWTRVTHCASLHHNAYQTGLKCSITLPFVSRAGGSLLLDPWYLARCWTPGWSEPCLLNDQTLSKVSSGLSWHFHSFAWARSFHSSVKRGSGAR